MNSNSIFSQLQQAGIQSKHRGRFQLVKLVHPHQTLPHELKETLLISFCQITDEIYAADTSFYWLSKPDYYASIHHLWLVFEHDELLGFTATQLHHADNERIIYIDNMNIKQTSKKKFMHYSVGAMLVNEILQGHALACHRLITVVFRTQNANVYCLGYSMLPAGIYPRIDHQQTRNIKRSLKINRLMAAKISPGKYFNADMSVIKNAYPGSIYGHEQKNNMIQSRHKDIMNFWHKNVNIDNGDAVLISICAERHEFLLALCLYRFHICRYHVSHGLNLIFNFAPKSVIKE